MVEHANIIEAKARCQETASQLVHLLLENLDLLGQFTGGAEVNAQGARGSIGIEAGDG